MLVNIHAFVICYAKLEGHIAFGVLFVYSSRYLMHAIAYEPYMSGF